MRVKWIMFGEGGSVSFKAKLHCIGNDLCLSHPLHRQYDHMGPEAPAVVSDVTSGGDASIMSALVHVRGSGRAVVSGPMP